MNMTKDLLEMTKYKRTIGELRFSSSMFSQTDLQNFLTIVYGPEEPTDVGQNTLGSIFHLGMENGMDSDNDMQINEYTMQIKNWKDTGWILSGTADRITYSNTRHATIKDYKLTKLYAGTSVKKDLNHAYRRQLNVLRMLLQESDDTLTGVDMELDMFYKDADILYHQKAYENIPIQEITDIEQQTLDKVMSIDALIKAGEMPPECSTKDVWIRKLKTGVTVRSRCVAYCSVSHVCPYFTKETPKQVLSRW